MVHEREWLFRGHRSTEWCPRCGTSLSQHELNQTDRVTLTLPTSEADLLAHSDSIAREVLAVGVEVDGAIAEPAIAKVS